MTHSSLFIAYSILFSPRETYKKITMVNWKLSGVFEPKRTSKDHAQASPIFLFFAQSRSHSKGTQDAIRQNVSASSSQSKSEEVKLEVTRAPTIRLRMHKFQSSRVSNFAVTEPINYVRIVQAHYASHCIVPYFMDRFARYVGRKRLKLKTYTSSEAIKRKFENAECFSS